MKKILLTVLLTLSVITAYTQELQPKARKVTQYSTSFAISSGLYDSGFDLATLASYGDFGFGYANALDGEVVMLNGASLQIFEDGTAFKASPSLTTPFATVCFFNPKAENKLKDGITMKEFLGEFETYIPSTNMICAFAVDARFKLIITRSMPKQLEKPYRPLAEITLDKQKRKRFVRQRGTIVGFYFPKYLNGINVSGCSMYFVSSDKKSGGRVLDFTLDKGKIMIDEKSEFEMILPTTPDFKKIVVNAAPAEPATDKKPVVAPIENKKEQPVEAKPPVEVKPPVETKPPVEVKPPAEVEKKAE